MYKNNTSFKNYKIFKFSSLLLLILVLFTSSCNLVKDVEFKGVKNVEFGGISSSEIKIKIEVLVHNPNSFKIKVVDGKINVKSTALEIGEINITDDIIIPAKTEQKIELNLSAPIKSLFSSKTIELYQLIQKKKFPLTIKGEIKGKALGISKIVKIDQTQEISL